MAIAYKVLGQTADASSEVDLYTVPASTSAVVSTVVACNRDSSSATFRIYVAIAGAAAANEQYTHYDVTLGANDTFAATLGLTLATTDVLRVFASAATVSFSAFGSEHT